MLGACIMALYDDFLLPFWEVKSKQRGAESAVGEIETKSEPQAQLAT